MPDYKNQNLVLASMGLSFLFLLKQIVMSPALSLQMQPSISMEILSSREGWVIDVSDNISNNRCKQSSDLNKLTSESKEMNCINDGRNTSVNKQNRTLEIHKAKGLIMAVFDQYTGNRIFSREFPLHQYWAHWADLEWHVSQVASGRIVSLTISKRGAYGLRHARIKLAQMGSILVQHINQASYWNWVYVQGGKTLAETTVLYGQASTSTHSSIFLKLHNEIFEDRRWDYCHKYGAVGDFCEVENMDKVKFPNPPPVKNQSAIDNIPIIVTAGSRYQYLYYTLKNIVSAPGSRRENILVIFGDAPKESTELLDILEINYHLTKQDLQISNGAAENMKLFKFYHVVYQHVVTKFPTASAFIFMDEDVLVSQDLFSYMSQTLWLLDADPSLYCINGYAIMGTQGFAYDERKLFRGNSQPGWGYAVSLKFLKKSLSMWPTKNEDFVTEFHDMWLYEKVAEKGQCVFPEVSRIQHFGIGVNTRNIWMWEHFTHSMPMVQEAHVLLEDPSLLISDVWHNRTSEAIRGATVITRNPCVDNFFPEDPEQETNYVFYYAQRSYPNGTIDYYNFNWARKCLNIWFMNDQGIYNTILTIRFSNHGSLYMVGVPHSQYAHLRARGTHVWQVDANTEQEEESLMNLVKKYELSNQQYQVYNLNEEKLMNILSQKDTL